ncbi:hypothetical protein ALC56_14092 [Trachymyrmex septentrionalis]|uniref:DUF4817 domain-containing protein n=1 Tax=Trachymyrmex septentrionalis TaxID=34720 RepID=A0A195EUN6_9HYME|nr:hypothetical protein ALC56_14092 [Trachymyrmex septentrionalis]
MIFVYGECRQIMREAVRLYAERFPDCVHPSFSVFSNIVQTFQGIGSMDNKKTQTNQESLHQELHGNDFQNHVQFCEWALKLQEDDMFVTKILFIDAAIYYTNLLNRKFGHRWIDRSGNNRWATRSPELTPMDFYL